MAEAKNAAGQALEALGKTCKDAGVPFAGDTIERNVVYEGILEASRGRGLRPDRHGLARPPGRSRP